MTMEEKLKNGLNHNIIPESFPKIFEVQGIRYIEGQTSANRIHNLVANFEVRFSDIFLVGYPKTGNHWLKFIVSLIKSNEEEADLNTNIDAQMDWLEFGSPRMVNGRHENEFETFDRLNSLPDSQPRIFNTHLHWSLLPKNVSKGKIILIVRNPRDVAVSFYHFMVAQHVYFKYDESFQQFIDRFLHNDGPPFGCGSYFPFYSQYWKHFNGTYMLLVHYEDMKKDLVKEIRRIAQFLEVKLTEDFTAKVADLCSFENMRNHKSISALDLYFEPGKGRFLRKGQTGDWKLHMSPKQVASFELKEQQWFASSTFSPKYGVD